MTRREGCWRTEAVRRTRRHQEEAACELYSSLKVRRCGGGASWEPWEVCETREGWGVVRERQAEPLARETLHLERGAGGQWGTWQRGTGKSDL